MKVLVWVYALLQFVLAAVSFIASRHFNGFGWAAPAFAILGLAAVACGVYLATFNLRRMREPY